jgi:hypothetical protein
MNDLPTYDDCEAIKRYAESVLRVVRHKHTLQETAVICGVSTMTVGDICGTSKHPERRRQLYYVESAIKIINNYEANKDKKIIMEKNPDLKIKPWDKIPKNE